MKFRTFTLKSTEYAAAIAFNSTIVSFVYSIILTKSLDLKCFYYTCPDNDLLADDLLSDSESSDISPCVEEAFDANCDELIPDCEASCFRAPEFYIASEDDSILDDSASPDLRPRLEEVFDVNWNELTRDILEK